eukprot:Polyplicarium_translucidae@DN2664_c0_g1_i1.p1
MANRADPGNRKGPLVRAPSALRRDLVTKLNDGPTQRPRSQTEDLQLLLKQSGTPLSEDLTKSPLAISAVLHRGFSATVCVCSPPRPPVMEFTEHDSATHEQQGDPESCPTRRIHSFPPFVNSRLADAWQRVNRAVTLAGEGESDGCEKSDPFSTPESSTPSSPRARRSSSFSCTSPPLSRRRLPSESAALLTLEKQRTRSSFSTTDDSAGGGNKRLGRGDSSSSEVRRLSSDSGKGVNVREFPVSHACGRMNTTRALHSHQEKLVAKVVHKERCSPDELHRCYREVDFIRAIGKHDHILPLHSILETEAEICLFFEHATHGDLQAATKHRCLPERAVRRLVSQLLTALEHMHGHRLVHCDVKPKNLLVFLEDDVESDEVDSGSFNWSRYWDRVVLRLCDFGLVESLDGFDRVAFSGVRGTQGFLAPELLRRRSFDGKLDIWAVGVIAYQLLAGYDPFYPASRCAVDDAKVEFDPRYWDRYEALARDFIGSLLNVNPRERPTAKEALLHPWIESNRE